MPDVTDVRDVTEVRDVLDGLLEGVRLPVTCGVLAWRTGRTGVLVVPEGVCTGILGMLVTLGCCASAAPAPSTPPIAH